MPLISARSRHSRSGLAAAPLQVLGVTVLSLLCGLAAAAWLPDFGGTKLHGYVHPRTTTIVAPRGGVIAQIDIRTGDPLNPGSLIAHLADELLETRYQSKRGEIAAMEARLQTARAQVELDLDRHLRDVDSDICELQLRAAGFQKEKYDFELRKNMLRDVLASNQWAMFGETDQFMTSFLQSEESPEDRVFTVLRLEAVTNAAEVSTAQIESCEWNKERLEALRGRLPDVVRRSAGVDVLTAQLNQAQQDLVQLEQSRSGLEIKSTAVGKAGLLKITPGLAVAPGVPIVDVLDDIERVVVVNVPSAEIRQFQSGDEVRLTFPGRENRTGRITVVAPQAVVPVGSTGGESHVEVRVEASGELWPEVPAGTRVIVRAPSAGIF
jgi:multidrug resistance efflux pump